MAGLSIVGGLALDGARLRSRLELLTRQASSGQRGQTHGALGAEARRAIDLRGDIARREAYAAAADGALARMGRVQPVLARLETIASTTAADAARARTLGASGVESLARTARVALEEVAALLNTRDGEGYLFASSNLSVAPVSGAGDLFAGADLLSPPPPPVPPPLTGVSAMAREIRWLVSGLTPLNATTVLAGTATAATAAGTTPFSAALEGAAVTEPRRAVQVADGERVAWGVLANQDQSGEVVASWGRELLRGLATLAALTPASAAQGTGYDALLDGVRQGLEGATRDLAQERGALGAAERQVESVRERHRDLLVAVKAQLKSVEEVDLAAVSAEVTQTQTRLEASYRITAQVAQLSLAALLR
jgi:flagellin-like hook-associated protein FlgL